MLPAALFALALSAPTSAPATRPDPFEPLTEATIAAFAANPSPTEAPGPLRRLALYEAAKHEADPAKALSMFERLSTGTTPIAEAARFHATRLAVELGRKFTEDLTVIYGPHPQDRPGVRWDIRRSEQAALLLAIASRREREGNAKRAGELRRQAAMRFPRHVPLAEGATRSQQREYADALIRDMDYKGGVRVLEALLQDAEGDEWLSLRRRITEVWADLIRDDYPKIAGLVSDTIERTDGRNPDDVMMLAYALGKFDPAGGVSVYRAYLELFESGPAREEAAFFIAWTDFDLERFEAAVAGFDAFLEAHPHGVFVHAARWYRGLCLYRLGRLRGALDDFQYTETHGKERDKGTYWTARVLAQLGRTEEANRRYSRLAASDPFGYYGIIARARIDGARPPVYRPEPERTATTIEQLRRELSALPTPVGASLSEALAIAQTGRWELATQMLRQVVTDNRGVLSDGPLLAELQRRCGDFTSLVQGGEATQCRPALAADPAQPQARHCWQIRYPRAYLPLIEQLHGDFPIAVVWSIMRQESYYRPDARSIADAQGLMQLVPQVAGPAAHIVGEPYEPYEATRPETNLRWFFASMRARFERFGRQVPLFLMSYNATPQAAAGWLEENRDLPFDLFVEEISFKETRDYVKRISGHLARYRTLLGEGDTLLERAGLPHPDQTASEAFAAALSDG